MTRRQELAQWMGAHCRPTSGAELDEFYEVARNELVALWAVVDAAKVWDENADSLSHDVIERALTDALDAYHRGNK